MKKLLSLILSLTMLTSVAQLTAFADIESPDSTSEVGSSLSAEVGGESDSSDSTQATDSTEASANSVQQTTDSEEEHTHATEEDSSAEAYEILSKTESVAEMVSSSADLSDNFTSSEAYKKYPVFANLCKQSVDMSSLFGKDGDTTCTVTRGSANNEARCKHMVPQGFCSAVIGDKRYLLVSAYCARTSYTVTAAAVGNNVKGDKHKSVIYVYDNPTTGSPTYKGTLVLPCYSHVGGIAYDKNYDYLWVALNHHSNAATASSGYVDCFKLSTKINSFSGTKTNVVVSRFDIRDTYDKLGDPAIPDCMMYNDDNDRLYVCKFEYASGNDGRYNGGVSIATRYEMTTYRGKNGAKNGADLSSTGTNNIPCDRIQGFQFIVKNNKTSLIVARSYSRDPIKNKTDGSPSGNSDTNYISELLIYDYDNNNALKGRIKMPPMVEGVSYDERKNLLYVTFESGSYQFNGGETNKAYNKCPAPVPYIVALDIEDYLNYDKVLDLGGISGTENLGEAGYNDGKIITTGATERIILDQNLPADKIGKNSDVDYDVSGTDFLYEYTAQSETYHATIYNSSVAAGKNVLVKLHGNVDVAANVQGKTYATDGFYVKDGGTLNIRSVKKAAKDANGNDIPVSIRRNKFKYTTPNEIYKSYIIGLEKGGNLKITNKDDNGTEYARIRMKGGGETKYVQATDSWIRTLDKMSGTSSWYIEGVDFEGITCATASEFAYAPCIFPYHTFTDFIIKDCNFRNVFAKKGKVYTPSADGDKWQYGAREGAAISFTRSFNATNSVEISDCNFNNDYNSKGITLLKDEKNGPYLSTNTTVINNNRSEFEAIRFFGKATSMTMSNLTFENFQPEYGVVGFVRRNYADYKEDNPANGNKLQLDTDGNKISTLTINNISMKNCKSTATSTCDLQTVASQKESDKEKHYYGSLTFGSAIDTLTVKDPKFEECSGYSGGAICFDSPFIQTNGTVDSTAIGDVTIKSSSESLSSASSANPTAYFNNCEGSKNGGAISIYGHLKSLLLQDVKIDGCKSTNGSAIMIYDDSEITTSMNITNSLVQNCVSYPIVTDGNNYSGTIRTTGKSKCNILNVDNCEIKNNKVWKDGGGIYWNSQGKLNIINGTKIHENHASESGGGVYCESVMNITGAQIYENTSGEDGGGICQTVYSNAKGEINKTNNLAVSDGTTINNNYAANHGGGVAIKLRDSANLSTEALQKQYSLSFSLTNASVTNNTALNCGGGIYYGRTDVGDCNANGTSTAAQVTNISKYQKAINLYSGSKVNNNYAGDRGGGIFAREPGVLVNILDAEVNYNRATVPDNFTPAVTNYYKYNFTSTETDPNAKFTENSITNAFNKYDYRKGDTTSYKNGGGIYIRDIDNEKDASGNEIKQGIIFKSGQVNGNYSGDKGGGVYATHGAILKMYGGELCDNTAVNGGAIGANIDHDSTYLKDTLKVEKENTKIYLYGGTIAGNTATQDGGAVYGYKKTEAAAASTVTISLDDYTEKNTHVSITGNKAYRNGGAICSDNATINVNGASVIEKNYAGYNEGTSTSNKGGGGAVFVMNGGSVNVTGGIIRYNEALGDNTATTAYNITDVTGFAGIGGAVCVAKGSFSLSGANMGIYSNTAEFAADDVYASGNGTQLNVPNKAAMNLTEYNGKATGWFEDYANGESNYIEGTYLGNNDGKTKGSRYRTEISTEYSDKYEIENVNENALGDVVNAANAFVCMTLGTLAKINVTNNLTDYKGNPITGSDSETFTYLLTAKNNGKLPENLIYEIGGASKSVTLSNTKEYKFSLKGGETIGFPNLPVDLTISCTQQTTKSNINYLKSTSGQNTVKATSTSTAVTTDFKDYNAIDINTNNAETQVVFNNQLMGIEVVINFYDRAKTSGQPANIDTAPTKYTKVFAGKDCESYMNQADPISAMILAAVANDKDKYQNVVDDYIMWTSQANAVTGMKGLLSNENYKDLLGKSGKYDNTDDYAYRANHKCEPQSDENWVSYKNYSGGTVTQTTYESSSVKATEAQNIQAVNVWMLNTPKKYSVTIHALDSSNNITASGEKYIVTDNMTKSGYLYYNQRLGTADKVNSDNDASTDHLGNYGLDGYIKDENCIEAKTLPEFKSGSNTYKFSYWSFDKDGKTVASTNISYDYRVTQKVELYAVYEKTAKTTVGVTTTMNRPDVYFDSNGVQRTRLNTMINPYNCQDNDDNIKAVAAVYVVPNGNAPTDAPSIKAAVESALKDANPTTNTAGKLQISIGKANYTVYFGRSVLTNKNRAQFVLDFKTETLKSKTIYAVTAMKYDGNWIASDNYINYNFNEYGVFTGAEDNILGENQAAASN